MRVYQVNDVKRVLNRCIDVILSKKDELTAIDSQIGDGDLGVSMEKGGLALRASIDAYEGDVIGPMFMKGGMAFNSAAPSTMGTLMSMSLVALGRGWKEQTTLTEEDLILVPRLMADAIAKQGKAEQGDKTILDALYPYAEALETDWNAHADFSRALVAAAAAARAGMEATRGMQARVGRARWLGERSAEAPDGGAVLCVHIADALAASDHLQEADAPAQ